jgi:hypothetical protein
MTGLHRRIEAEEVSIEDKKGDYLCGTFSTSWISSAIPRDLLDEVQQRISFYDTRYAQANFQ